MPLECLRQIDQHIDTVTLFLTLTFAPSIVQVTRYTSPDQITEAAPLGIYIHGVYLEGARWDREEVRFACIVY